MPLSLLLSLVLAATTNASPPATEPVTSNVAPVSTAAPAAPSKAQQSMSETEVLKEIAPGIFDYHGIRLDKKNHRIVFDGVVNQRVGLIEYVLVNEKGKVHESLLSTKAMPHDLHVAMLLIGLKENEKVNAAEPVPPSAIDSAYLHAAPKLKGPPVLMSVAWTVAGKHQNAGLEDWVLNLHTNRAMLPGPWTYNGSLVEDGQFLADQDLSIAAVVTDPTALVNNPREGYDDDQIWQVQDKVVPAIDTPVEITFTLAAPSK